jgi:uncharacterized protein (PEP-CTERM system associated)
MATTHRDAGLSRLPRPTPGLSLLLWCGLSASGWPAAQAQTQTTRIEPSVSMQSLATSNANAAAGVAGQGKKEMILSVTPGIKVMTKGANTQIDAQWQLNVISYVRNTQPDRILPSGLASLHTEVLPGEAGLDASVSSSQVKSTFTARSSSTPSTADTYTNYMARISPFAHKQLDAQTQAGIRLERVLLHSNEVGLGLVARPDSRVTDDTLNLTRRTTPFGYDLRWRHQETRVSGQDVPSLNERLLRATALYAFGPELELGLSLGRSTTQVNTQKLSETTHGWQVQWHPSERSLLKTSVEDRFYGRSWQLEAAHRSPWLAMGLQADRVASTYAASLGNIGQSGSLRTLYDALLTTRIPNEADRRKAVDDMIARRNLAGQVSTSGDVYDEAAQVRQSTTGRVALMGRRDILAFAGGLVRTAPLATQASAIPLVSQSRTKEYYFDAQLNHQLTPYSTVTGGLRWTRARFTPSDPITPATLSRDFSWRALLSTTLTPNTTATMGLKRQLTHNPSTTSSDEATMFVGLGHRF